MGFVHEFLTTLAFIRRHYDFDCLIGLQERPVNLWFLDSTFKKEQIEFDSSHLPFYWLSKYHFLLWVRGASVTLVNFKIHSQTRRNSHYTAPTQRNFFFTSTASLWRVTKCYENVKVERRHVNFVVVVVFFFSFLKPPDFIEERNPGFPNYSCMTIAAYGNNWQLTIIVIHF